MLRQRKVRRTVGAALVIAGGVLMWLAPEATFGSVSISGLVLLVAGIVLEVVGIAFEHRDRRKHAGRS
jgi:uncharacterized membrane protein HdeD (DUF308 family)